MAISKTRSSLLYQCPLLAFFMALTFSFVCVADATSVDCVCPSPFFFSLFSSINPVYSDQNIDYDLD